MVNSLRKRHTDAAMGNGFQVNGISEPTLADVDSYYELFSVQGDKTTAYGAGFGRQNANTNTDGWSDIYLQNGAGAAIDGHVRYRIYRDSSKEDLIAQSTKYTLATLRAAVSESRTDKALIPAMFSQIAGEDSYLTVEVSPDASSIGDVVSKANSDSVAGLAYSELPL